MHLIRVIITALSYTIFEADLYTKPLYDFFEL